MKNNEVIDRILAYHPKFGKEYNGCDGYKYGNGEDECTGVVAALVPTVDVIRETKRLGCNLLIVHEPTFYSTPDFPDWRAAYRNSVYEEKCKLLDEYGITIWRDHDHMHAHQPDSIFSGVEKYLGWTEKRIKTENASFMTYCYDIGEMTVEELNKYLMDKIGITGLRYIGRKNDVVRKVAIVGHLCPGCFGPEGTDENGFYYDYSMEVIRLLENEVDAIIPGEVIDWTALSYVRDAVMLGKVKAVFNIGHFALEELGMKYARDWMEELVEHRLPVHYVATGDMYSFHTAGCAADVTKQPN